MLTFTAFSTSYLITTLLLVTTILPHQLSLAYITNGTSFWAPQYDFVKLTVFTESRAEYALQLEFPERSTGPRVTVNTLQEVEDVRTAEDLVAMNPGRVPARRRRPLLHNGPQVMAAHRTFLWSACYPFQSSSEDPLIRSHLYHESPLNFTTAIHIHRYDTLQLDDESVTSEKASRKVKLDTYFRQVKTHPQKPWLGFVNFESPGLMKYIDNDDGCMETSPEKVVTVLPHQDLHLRRNATFTFFVSTAHAILHHDERASNEAMEEAASKMATSQDAAPVFVLPVREGSFDPKSSQASSSTAFMKASSCGFLLLAVTMFYVLCVSVWKWLRR